LHAARADSQPLLTIRRQARHKLIPVKPAGSMPTGAAARARAFYTAPMTLLFIRHGETALNASRTLQPADTPLSARGLAQAQAVAARLAPLGLAGVLSSDLPRAWQTARAIAAAAGGLPVQASPLLHERNFGDLRGRPHDSLGFDPLAMTEAPPGGESWADFLARVDRAFELAVRVRATLAGPLAVVTHGLLIKALLGRQLALPPGGQVPARIGNTSVTMATATVPHQATLVDCVAHLQGAVSEDGRSLSGG
jgi:probable phosphoglycerate mutase